MIDTIKKLKTILNLELYKEGIDIVISMDASSLFRATKMTCIDDINADNSNELVTIINNNVIVCYQIPSLN